MTATDAKTAADAALDPQVVGYLLLAAIAALFTLASLKRD